MSQILGERWEVVKSLAEGGQSHTFLVIDRKGSSEAHYVLKRLKNQKRLDRFKREVETIRSFTDPHIVHLIDFDLDAEKPYLVTEYCVGGSLDTAEPFWRPEFQGPLPGRIEQPMRALELFYEICEGVLYAHQKGVVHRDIKPANIFLREPQGAPVIGDFGICYVEDGERFTLTEENVGPRNFIAPELEEGRATTVTTKSDVYSLGKLLYWLITGKTVFREGFREPHRDLKGLNSDSVLGWNNIYLEHVNHILDLMIVHEPDERRDLDNILILLRRTLRKVERELNPTTPKIKQLCTYCGEGYYVERADGSPNQVRNFGFNPVGGAEWRIYTCGECGHVQMFRAENARERSPSPQLNVEQESSKPQSTSLESPEALDMIVSDARTLVVHWLTRYKKGGTSLPYIKETAFLQAVAKRFAVATHSLDVSNLPESTKGRFVFANLTLLKIRDLNDKIAHGTDVSPEQTQSLIKLCETFSNITEESFV